MWGSIAAAAISTAGGLLGNKSSAREAKKQRNWEEYMSNTAHRREVEDLKAAGLNPMLSGMGGSGSVTPSSGIPTMQNPLEGASQKVQQSEINSATADNIKANTEKLNADTLNTQANTAKTVEETLNVPKQGKLLDNQSYKISYEIPQILRQGNLTDSQVRNTEQITSNLVLQRDLTSAQVKETLARANLSNEQIRLVTPQILKLHAETKLSNAKVGYEEAFSLPGDIADRLFSNSAYDSSRSSTSNAIGSTPRYVRDKLNDLTNHVRSERKKLDKQKGR